MGGQNLSYNISMLTKTQAFEIFEKRVRPRISISTIGCWTIPLSDNGGGYVYIRVRSLSLRIGIHVLSYLAHNDGQPIHVLHKCDNPSCCNPDHLFSGTQADNMRDMDSKGRRGTWHPVGDKNPSKRKDVRYKLKEFAETRKRLSDGTFL
jgi:HNH endonuclease